VRDEKSRARITMANGQAEIVGFGPTNFCLLPDGINAEAEVTAEATTDCVGMFVAPSFVPDAVKPALTQPMLGFSNAALGRVFHRLAGELRRPSDVPPVFAEARAMQALGYVAETAYQPQLHPALPSGLAPWQLRRSKEMFLANLSENLSLTNVAAVCKLSVSHFGRAFKHSTGLPPRQWVTAARVEEAQKLLAKSHTPLAEVAVMCGFSDQSHFSRIFGRVVGASPGVWRREHLAIGDDSTWTVVPRCLEVPGQ
jgi:AraC-like DNA-binding protein